MSKRTKYGKDDKPLSVDELKPKDRPFGFASRPVCNGTIERAGGHRKLKRKHVQPTESELDHARFCHKHGQKAPKKYKTVYFEGKRYRVPANIVTEDV